MGTRTRAPRHRAGTYHGVKLSRSRQLDLAANCSEFWRREVDLSRTKFPPAADQTPMRQCHADPKNCAQVVPAHYLTVNLDTGKCECQECIIARHERWMNRLRREELLTDEALEQERENHRRRIKGLPTTDSASASANMQLYDLHGQVIEMKLPTENVEELTQQVGRYMNLMPSMGHAQAVRIVFSENGD